jgi:hypothetical protein
MICPVKVKGGANSGKSIQQATFNHIERRYFEETFSLKLTLMNVFWLQV